MNFLSDIVQFSYSAEELKKCFRRADLWHYRHEGITEGEIDARLAIYSNNFFSSDAAITQLNMMSLGKDRIFSPANVQDALCLRRTNHILKKALRSPLINRDDEVKQLLQVLNGETECNIFRTDIKSYFESLSFARLISKLESDGLRNNSALKHLRNLNSLLLEQFSYAGIPRGLALSSTLAEYALQEFDRIVYNSDSAIYYTRYVDDICIVHFGDSQIIERLIERNLPFGLTLNGNKTYKLSLPSETALDFLGYKISLSRPRSVSIADTKIAKAKKRIALSIREFVRDRNFDLLLCRLRFLTCSIRMKKVGRKFHVCTGYRHVYRHCTKDAVVAQLNNLDGFLHGILNSRRYSLAVNLQKLLTREQKNLLRTISFEQNYTSKLTFNVSPQKMATIKRAWRYG